MEMTESLYRSRHVKEIASVIETQQALGKNAKNRTRKNSISCIEEGAKREVEQEYFDNMIV